MSDHSTSLERLRDVVADPNTMSVIVQRITDADEPETLKDIARSWKVPLGKLAEWLTEDRDRAEQYANALRIAAEQHALETIAIVDAATPDDVAVAKLRADTRFKLASKLARDKFGEMNEVRVSGAVSLISVLSSLPRGNVIDVTPEESAPKKIPEKIAEKQELI